MALRPSISVTLVVAGIIAVAMAAVLTMYPSLSDAEDAGAEAWAELQPQLENRYGQLATLHAAVRDARPDIEALEDVERAVNGWEAAVEQRPTPDLENEPAAANRVEAAGARLAVSVAASPALRGNADIVEALRTYVTADLSAPLRAYNDAVRKYDNARSRFPGRFFANLLGFDTLRTVEAPPVLAELELPAPAQPAPPDEAPPEDGSG